MKAINVGLIGLGTVGSGVVNVLARNMQEISRRAGRAIEIKRAAVKNLSKERNCALSPSVITNDVDSVISCPEIDIVVELVGGTEQAYKYVAQALEHGKHVVTANKSLIAQYGNELFAIAERCGKMLAFEAAVAGGIPIIKALREGLSANHVQWLAGIINGTSNYILSEMHEHCVPFSEALASAQRLGFAEQDPTMDIGGYDAGHKLTILASIAFGMPLSFSSVYIEGIEQISVADIFYAKELGYKIKHLGIARRTVEGIELRVHPAFIPESCLLANVNGETNAVLVHGDAVGPTLYYGLGAGGEPTASAVIADLVDVTRSLTVDPKHHVPYLAFQSKLLNDSVMLPINSIESAYYIRLEAIDRPGMLGEITTALGDAGIGIEAALQKGVAEDSDFVPIVIVTHPVLEENMDSAISCIENIDGVHDDVMRIRIEYLDSNIEKI